MALPKMEGLLWLFLSLTIFGSCTAVLDHMLDEDVEFVEENILSRKERDLHGLPDFKLLFNFKNLSRLDVVTIEDKPYTYIEQKCSKDGKCKNYFRGFMVDLMYVIARRLRMIIRFYKSPDSRWGAYDEGNNTWNGMMGEVMKRTLSLNASGGQAIKGDTPVGSLGADIAAAPLTITALREKHVDFVKPFAHLGLTVLIKKPVWKSEWPYNFDIFKPLAPSVWLSAIIAMLVVWLFLWLMNRYNPYEYGERRRRNLATEEEASLFNASGSFWYMFTILQWQGYDRSPRSIASKTMSCFWMFFATVFLVVYIGAYVNNLFWASTVHGRDPMEATVKSLADLVSHKDEYTYGTMAESNTLRYLMEVASGEEFKIIRKYLNDTENKDKLVATFPEGVEKVRRERFGLICESMTARYIVNTRPCDLTTIDDFGARSYGLAVPTNSPRALLEKLHTIILEMIEEGDIETLEKKWFELKGECWNTSKAESFLSSSSQLLVNKPKQVNLEMFWSGIVLIIVGTAMSCLVAAAEILWFKYRGRYSASNRQRTQQLTNDDDGHI